MRSFIKFLAVFSVVAIGVAQDKKNDVVFSIDNDNINTSEFVRGYNKNLDLVKDDSQKDISNYLDLYVNYKLKVKKARELGYDKSPSYVTEFNSYKKQLQETYLKNHKVTDELVNETYYRMGKEINASHLVIRINPNSNDTISAYNKLLEFKKEIELNGFESIKKYVDGTSIIAEDLGYFSAFKTVYPFETVAFNTPAGKVSNPFRTKFGYHIVFVKDVRDYRGEASVSHIMVSNKQADSTVTAEERINSIYKQLQDGAEFESLAKQFSDDNNSSNRGGQLKPFKSGQLSSTEFEDVAFSMSEKNQLSEPFQTKYGWHIIKFNEIKGLAPLEEIKSEIENKVKSDSRSEIIKNSTLSETKVMYNVKVSENIFTDFTNEVDARIFNKSWKVSEQFDLSKRLFNIEAKQYTYTDFVDYLSDNQDKYFRRNIDIKAFVENEFNKYMNSELLDFRKENLVNENEEYAFILKEYEEGLLLFDLMEKEIWNKASKDTLGLNRHYEENKSNYLWKDRVKTTYVSGVKKKYLKQALKLVKKGEVLDSVLPQVNLNDKQNLILTKGTYEVSSRIIPKEFEFKKGVSKIYKNNDSYQLFFVEEVLPSEPMNFEDAKGKVISEYQVYLEDNLLKDLKASHDIQINEDVVSKLKSELN